MAAAPDANASTIPGTKWWMCVEPTEKLRNGPARPPPRRRIAWVLTRATPNVSEKDTSRLSSAFSRRDPDR
jgi:hypothetical protein